MLDREVQNDGFYQYFWDTRGKYNKDTLAFLHASGHAAVDEQVSNGFGGTASEVPRPARGLDLTR